jgi:hypothetical protein
MELSRPGGPEALPRIVQVPEVEVAFRATPASPLGLTGSDHLQRDGDIRLASAGLNGSTSSRFARSGLRYRREVDVRTPNMVRGVVPAVALDRGKRRIDDLTTEWIAARHLPTTATAHCPL